MAAKDIHLKKRLVREGIILLGLLIALGAGGYILSGMDDDAQGEKAGKESQNANMRSEQESIRQELGTGFEVSAFYETYIKNHNTGFLLDREAASRLLSVLREKNHLANLSVTISPVSDSAIDAVHLKSTVLTKSEMHLTFGAVTDNSVYGFIESLERALPGFVAIRDIKITRGGDLSSAVVLGLSQHRIAPIVTCELSFLWLGLRPADQAKATVPPGGGR